jgi:hypothetical protein
MPVPSKLPKISLLLILLAGSAVHAVEVKIDYDPTVDFARFRTIAWGEGTPADDPELEQRIHAAIERELIPLGIREVREDSDLLIITHASIDGGKTIDVTLFEYWPRYEGWKRPLAVADEAWDSPLGALVVDILEASTRRLLWRGVATGNVAKTSERRWEKLDRTMAGLFKGFPPRYRAGDG